MLTINVAAESNCFCYLQKSPICCERSLVQGSLLGAVPEQLSQLLVWEEHTAGLGSKDKKNYCRIGPERTPRDFGDNVEEDCHACLKLFDILTGRPGLGSSSRKQAQPGLVGAGLWQVSFGQLTLSSMVHILSP